MYIKGGERGVGLHLLSKKTKFHILNITNTLINIPWGVEAVWAILIPKNLSNSSKIRRIAVCSFYNRNIRSKFKTALVNHMAEAFNIISRKYTEGLHFILGADANHLKLDPILAFRSDMRSVVQDFTRRGPPAAMLDPIITTLASYYQRPVCQQPLDADEGSGGVPSDHMIVRMEPINTINNKGARTYRTVEVRPMPKSAMDNCQVEVKSHKWDKVFFAHSAHEKAKLFQKEHVQIVEKGFPNKKKIKKTCK